MKGRGGVVNGRYEKLEAEDNRGERGSDKAKEGSLWDKAVDSKELGCET